MKAIRQLERLRHLTERRPKLIRQALKDGHTYDEIADALGVSRATVFNILKRTADQSPE